VKCAYCTLKSRCAIMYEPDKCPHCGKRAMPAIRPESKATARRCQECGYVEELKPEEPPK
jgi:uncharacterized Zn finger protein